MQDKVILITGGTSGIGLAVAQRCAKEGAAVVIAARNKSESVVEELTALGGAALMLEVDVADEKGVQSMIEAALATVWPSGLRLQFSRHLRARTRRP